MRSLRAGVLLLSLPLLLGVDLLESRNRATEDGNQRFKAGKPEEALAEYDKAAARLPADPGVQFNRGAALYALSRFDEASEAFLRATEAKSKDRKAAAFYNLGNAYFQSKKFGEAVAAFKKSLAYDPADLRTKWNLELALKMKQDEDKKGDKKDDKNAQNKDKSDKDKQKDDKQGEGKDDKGEQKKDEQAQQDKKDEPKPPEPQKADENKDKPEDKSQAQKPQDKSGDKPGQPPPRPGTDPREVEAILDNLEKSPKSLEAELAKIRAANRRPPAKDW